MANSTAETDWNRGARQGTVSIGTHKLALDVSGPDRVSGQPVVLIMHVLTGSMWEWPAARRSISSIARVVDYDRSGLGLSEEGPSDPTALVSAIKLSDLLHTAKIEPPYITLAHSWGAILGLEFMNNRPQDIAGMVLAEGTALRFWEVLPMYPRVPAMQVVWKGMDYKGELKMKFRTKLIPEE